MEKAKKAVISAKAAMLAALVVLLLAVVPSAHADSWAATAGSMLEARTGHAMALLGDGRVLIVGGYNSSAVLASAEVYDPSAETFASTGPMSTPRWIPSATALNNNSSNILIAGGSYNGQELSSAELYDPASGVFSPTAGPMSTARRRHTATLLGNGTVLIAGGFNGSFISAAEVYDPSTKKFSAAGPMTAARRAHTATLLENGTVLITGGDNATGYLSSAELYDPASGKFTAAGSMGFSRASHSATILQDHKVLIAGGENATGYLSSAELYDPATGTFTPTGSMGTARTNHEASLLQNGRVLINGGYDGGYPSSAELYNPGMGTFSATASLISARTWHASVVLFDWKVLVTGGENGTDGYLSSAELYNYYIPTPATVPSTSTTTSTTSSTTTSQGSSTTTSADTGVTTSSTTSTLPPTTTTVPPVTTTTTPPAQVTVDFMGSPTSGKAPLTVHFTNLSTGTITDYMWLFGSGDTSREQNPVYTYKNKGKYSVTLIAHLPDKTSKKTAKDAYIDVQGCPMVSSLDNTVQIEILRTARDSVLKNLSGILLTAIWYRNLAEVDALLDRNPDLRATLKRLVAENIGVAQQYVTNGTATMHRAALGEAIDFLKAVRQLGSLQLQTDIDMVLAGMERGYLLYDLGIMTE